MRADTPEVTFVMPAYNAGDFIESAIDSILRQTVANWRLVIVNDGSTDDTLVKARQIAATDSRISVLSMEKASGSAYQPRKRAILTAETEWVAPIDADDLIEPTYLEKLIERQRKSGADIVYPTMADEETGNILTPRDRDLYFQEKKGADCVRLTLDGWKINCNGGIVRKTLYETAFEEYDSDVYYSCADELLTRQLLHLTPVVAFSPARYYYRRNPDSITRRASLKLFDYLINNRKLLDFTRENYGKQSEEYLLAHLQNFHGIFEALRLLNRHKFTKEQKREAEEMIKRNMRLMNYKVMGKKAGWKYPLLLRTGLKMTATVLWCYDKAEGLMKKREVS